MPAASVVNAASKLPWKQMIQLLPEVTRAAKRIWTYWESRPAQRPIDPSSSVASQVAAVAERVQALESNEKSQSEVISQIADQLQGLAVGLKETAARQAQTTRLCFASIAASSAAIIALVALMSRTT